MTPKERDKFNELEKRIRILEGCLLSLVGWVTDPECHTLMETGEYYRRLRNDDTITMMDDVPE